MFLDLPSVPAADSFRRIARRISDAHLRAEERAKATHGRFNVFTTLLRETDEVRLHTRFLHSLLDPEGLHDCGPLFLDLFLQMLAGLPLTHSTEPKGGQPWPNAGDGWTARKEADRSHGFGQIDLLLEHPRFVIAIENKIHAREQPGQLASYAAYLRSRAESGSRLIYLTLHGSASDTHGGADYWQISYSEHILGWLEKCLRRTYDIIPVNQLLLQYRAVVRKLTGKTLEAPIMKSIAQFIAVNPDIMRYRQEWQRAVDEAKSMFLDSLAQRIIDALPEFLISQHPGNEDERFGTETGGLIIRGKAGEALLESPFEVYLENATYDNELALGVFTNYEGKKLSQSEQEWITAFKQAWQTHPLGKESLESGPTEPWPLGWLNLGDLDDASFASMMEKEDLVACLTVRIKAYVAALQSTKSSLE